MSQQKKPREYYINDKGAEVYQHDRSKKHFECSTRPTWKNETHVIEKSAFDIAVAALKKIHEEDKNPYNHNINGPEKCAICIAKEALKDVGVDV